jgi:hypothetical protein
MPKAKQHMGNPDRMAMFVFMVFLVAVIFLLDAANDQEQPASSEELIQKLVLNGNEQKSLAFVVKDKVDSSKLADFASKDYAALKEELGVEYDFTLYFEDEQGNLVPIGDRYCIGSNRAEVSGFSCG